MSRPTLDLVMLGVATCLAQRATCSKLKVGCVLVDEDGHIIGSGYNGNPRDMPHCIDEPCKGASAPKGSDLCEAVHAEANALLNCQDVSKIYTCYTTHAPCLRCAKTLLNTGCYRIVYYTKGYELSAMDLWLRADRYWDEVDGNFLVSLDPDGTVHFYF